MKKSGKSFLFITSIIFVLTFSVVSSQIVFAKKKDDYTRKDLKQGDTFFSISPPSFDLNCHGNEQQTISVKIENPHPQPIEVSLRPVGLSPTGGPDLVTKPISSLPPTDLSRHVVVEAARIILPPKSFKQVSVTLDVPEGLSGTQYLGLTVANTSEEAIAAEFGTGIDRTEEYKVEVGVGMQPAIGITVKCHMEGKLKYAYNLEKLSVKPASGNDLPKIIASIKNTGNAEIEVFPVMILLDSQQKVVGRLKAGSREVLIPIAVKDIEFSSQFKDIPSGKYKAILSMSESKYQLPALEKYITIP